MQKEGVGDKQVIVCRHLKRKKNCKRPRKVLIQERQKDKRNGRDEPPWLEEKGFTRPSRTE